jgi:hypothetical protein
MQKLGAMLKTILCRSGNGFQLATKTIFINICVLFKIKASMAAFKRGATYARRDPRQRSREITAQELTPQAQCRGC